LVEKEGIWIKKEPPISDEQRRSRIMQAWEKIYEKTRQIRDKRDPFEKNIQRPYFHYKPLEESDLKNWDDYLTFQEKEEAENNSTVEDTIMLYERCLVSAANYPRYWQRYGAYLERLNRLDAAREVYTRATTVFTKRQPDVYFTFADFEERQGQVDQAKQIYKELVDHVAPVLIEGIIEYANFLRRQSIARQGQGILLESSEVSKVYEHGLLRLEDKIGVKRRDIDVHTKVEEKEEDKEVKEVSSEEDKDKIKWKSDYAFLSIHYARFQAHILQNASVARSIFSRAVHIVNNDVSLWLTYINFEVTQAGIQGQFLVPALYERALENLQKEPKELRTAVGELYLAFLRDRGTSISQIKQTRDKLQSGHFDEAKSDRKRPEIGPEEIEYGDRTVKITKTENNFQPVSTTFSSLASQPPTASQVEKPAATPATQSSSQTTTTPEQDYAVALQQQYWNGMMGMMGQMGQMTGFPTATGTAPSTATSQASYMQFPQFPGVFPQQWGAPYY